ALWLQLRALLCFLRALWLQLRALLCFLRALWLTSCIFNEFRLLIYTSPLPPLSYPYSARCSFPIRAL
ncbi:MAG: hypothetical protein AABZ32_03120, partial [Bacteroidota bacterium]